MKPSRLVFVTGGTGYMGRRAIPLLLARGHRVRALVREGSQAKVPPGCEAVVGNALEEKTFASRVAPADTLLQLIGVAHPSPAKAAEFRAVDLASARASARAAAAAGVGHEGIRRSARGGRSGHPSGRFERHLRAALVRARSGTPLAVPRSSCLSPPAALPADSGHGAAPLPRDARTDGGHAGRGRGGDGRRNPDHRNARDPPGKASGVTMEWKRDGFTISTEKERLDRGAIHEFLSHSYWAKGIPRELVDRSIQHSLCFGLY